MPIRDIVKRNSFLTALNHVRNADSHRLFLFAAVMAIFLTPGLSWACACGCAVFDVGTRSILPTSQGGLAFLEYNFMDQNKTWSAGSRASADSNRDKEIRTDFFTAGCQYMFNREWGILLEVPYWKRTFDKTDDNGDLVRSRNSSFGDIRIKAVYSGFSPAMSSGVSIGVKLATGETDCPGFDRDTDIGSGSTDALFGAFMRGHLPVGRNLDWFVNGQLDVPVIMSGDYRPGSDLNAIAGIHHTGVRVGGARIVPVAQAIFSHHWQDSGSNSDPDNSGYDTILLSPGAELDMAGFKIYADAGFPVYQYVNGTQLVAPVLFTVRLSHSF
ncbi:MAG: hypothetical protein WCN95_06495 [bacterium]